MTEKNILECQRCTLCLKHKIEIKELRKTIIEEIKNKLIKKLENA